MSKKIEVVVRGKAYSFIENGKPKSVPVGGKISINESFFEANKDRFEIPAKGPAK